MNRYFTPKSGTTIRDVATGKTYVTGDLIDGSTDAGIALVRANRWKLMSAGGRAPAPGPARETRDLGDIPSALDRDGYSEDDDQTCVITSLPSRIFDDETGDTDE